MKLNKLQRYTAYILLLDVVENDCVYDKIYHGICYAWFLLTDRREMYGGHYGTGMKYILPELFELANKDSKNNYIFYSYSERVAALKQCIIETHP